VIRPKSGFLEIYLASAWLWAGGNVLFAAGLLGALDRPTVIFLGTLIGAGLLAIAFQARSIQGALLGAARAHPVAMLSLVGVVAAESFLALAPPTARDALIHHLALPRLFLQAGGVIEVPFAIHASYPQTADMLYLIPLGEGRDQAAAFIHLGFGLLAAAVLAARARRWANDLSGIFAALLFLSLPVVVFLSSVAYVDLPLCLFSFLGLEAFLRWREANGRAWWLALSAIAVGFAISTKYQGFLVAAVLALLVTVAAFRQGGIIRAAKCVALFSLLVIVPPAPWLVRNASVHGDPVYPLFSDIVGDAPVHKGVPAEADSLSPLALRRIMYGESMFEIAALPLRIFVSGRENDPRRFDGRLNPLLPFLALGLLVVRRGTGPFPGAGAFASFAILGTLLSLTMDVARARYVLPFVSVLCPLASTAATTLPRRSLLLGLLALALAWNGFFLFERLRGSDLLPYFSGAETRAAYLARKLPAYPLYASVNALVPKNGRVQLLFMGDRGYYLNVPYTYESYYSGAGIGRALEKGSSALDAYFGRRGVTHLLVNEVILRKFLEGKFGPWGIRAWEAFANTRLVKLDAQGPFALYEILKYHRNQ
jgi:hypothetical protein